MNRTKADELIERLARVARFVNGCEESPNIVRAIQELADIVDDVVRELRESRI